MGRKKGTNEIIADHGDWLEVDISTPRFPDATMYVDKDVFERHNGGRIYAVTFFSKYIYAVYNAQKVFRNFHRDVIDVPDGAQIDHIIHGTMHLIDNRRSNLRVVSHIENSRNRGVYSNNSSGITGVSWCNRESKWLVKLTTEGKSIFLGYFDNIEFAIVARQQAERQYFGEFAFKKEEKNLA